MSVHSNHRLRLKNRFLIQGLDSYDQHNVLELLLFYALPQKDTNEIAHELIKMFGSLTDVFDAPFEELVKINGVKEHTATLIKLIPGLSRLYFQGKSDFTGKYMDYDKIGEGLVARYIGRYNETVMAVFFNSRAQAIDTIILHEGSINSVAFSARTIVEYVIQKNASYVVLSHNHPRGLPIASGEDLATTKQIEMLLNQINVTLLEHYIIAGDTYSGIFKTMGKTAKE